VVVDGWLADASGVHRHDTTACLYLALTTHWHNCIYPTS